MDNDLSTILLDKQHVTVGETVTLFWHGGFTTSSTDWIGLFYSGDAHSVSNCLDYKQSGETTGKKGLKWLIGNNINLQEAENKCWFKYVHGASGSVKAMSQMLYVINPDLQGPTSPSGTLTTRNLFSGQLLEFTITGMEANNLKRTLFGRPSPYVKVHLRPGRMQRKAWRLHHGLIGKTPYQSNTTQPSWRDEVFEFRASIWDILEVEVRNKSTGMKPTFSRFLGKLQFPLRELLTMGRSRTQTFTRQLMKREPSHKVLGTFSLTIKTNRDLPGSRRSRRLASPDGNEAERPRELTGANGTIEGEPGNELNRQSSLNASTPDDDQSYRDRTLTTSVLPGRTLAEVYRNQAVDAQSQPDLLGLPYTTHENVRMRKKTGNNKYNSSTFSNELTSRLSMPTFVLSNASLRSMDNYPCTSSSYTNDMSLDNEDSEVGTCQEQHNSSVVEENAQESNDPVNTSSEIVDNEGTSQSNLSSNIPPTTDDDVEETQFVPERENNSSSVSTGSHPDGREGYQGRLVCSSDNSEVSHTTENCETNNENSEMQLTDNDTRTSEIEREPETGTATVENETNVDTSDTGTLSLVSHSARNNEEENNEEPNRVGEISRELPQDLEVSGSEMLSEAGFQNTFEGVDTGISESTPINMSCEQLSSSLQELPFLEDSPSLLASDRSSPSSGIVRMGLPPTDNVEESTTEEPVDLVSHDQGDSDVTIVHVANTEENTNSSDSSLLSNGMTISNNTENTESSVGSLIAAHRTDDNGECGEINGNRDNGELLFNTSLPRMGNGIDRQSFMDIELEPDIMNMLSIHDTSSADFVMSSQSSNVNSSDGTSSRRTRGCCNLRTLFQVPDNADISARETCEEQETVHPTGTASSSEETSLANGSSSEGLEGQNPPVSPSESNSNSANTSQDETEAVSISLSNHVLSVFSIIDDRTVSENVRPSETLRVSDIISSENIQTIEVEPVAARLSPMSSTFTNINGQDFYNSATTTAASDSTTEGASCNTMTPTPLSNGETTAQRTVLPSRVPSITHVRYLRSKNLSIRLPSGTSTPLPVVHVVPPHVPVSPNATQDENITETSLTASSIEAEPILSATLITDSTVSNFDDELVTADNPLSPRIDLDIQDGAHGNGNAEPSTSHSGACSSGASAADPGLSVMTVSHSTARHRGDTSSDSGNVKVKRKGKSRNRASRESTNTESARQTQARRRRSEEASNRQLDVPQNGTACEQDTVSSHRPASIYVQISDFPSDEEVSDEPLPPHWERAVDTYGRVYYIDHENRVTTWTRPSAASATETSLNEVNHHRQNLDRRYQSFRRTISGRRRRRSRDGTTDDTNTSASSSSDTASTNDTSTTTTARASNDTTASAGGTSQATRTSSHRSSGDNRLLLNSNFVKFLTRADLTTFLRNSGAPGQYYFSHPELKDMVKRIREDPRNYQRFMHDRSLVLFLNGFADTSQPLPRGWEQKTDQYGQIYYVDHNSKSTNFADPRLPVDASVSRNRSRATLETAYADRSRRPPPPGLQRTGNSPNTATHGNSERRSRSEGITYDQQIVEFLRQPNIDTVLSEKDPSYSSNVALKCSVEKIRRDGQRALRLLSDNVGLIVLLSLFEDDIVSFVPEIKQKPTTTTKKRNSSNSNDDQGPSSRKTSKPAPYKRDFQAKVKSFHKNAIHKGLGQGPNKIQLIIRRDHILEDAFDQIMKENPRNLQKSKLEVKFSGEEGLDYGGPQRELFFLLSRQLFNPYYGLFEYSAQDTYTLHISAMSSFVDNAHEWYRFSGRIIALVIIHQHLLDAFFTRPFYKLLLKSSCDLRDVEALDALFHRSLAWIMESDISEESLDLSFTVTEEVGGQVSERELLAGGKDIRVTEDNKLGYVELMSNWRIDRGVSGQRKSILKGFYEIMDYDFISIFDACELELLISGTADIDVNDWRTNTEYRSGYHPNHKVIRWFWQAVHSFDNERRLRLLQFVTGTSSVPYEGFAALRGSTGPRKFCIERWANHTMLPRAHTCFNRLDLPPYNTYDELLNKLTLAVEETSTFGIQ